MTSTYDPDFDAVIKDVDENNDMTIEEELALLNKVMGADEAVTINEEDLSTEAKEIFLKGVSCRLTKLITRVMGKIFVRNLEAGGKGDHTDIATDAVNLGWKKESGKWEKVKITEIDQEISDVFKTTILGRADIVQNDISWMDEKKSQFLKKIGLFIQSKVFRMRDSIVHFKDEAQAFRLAKEFLFVQGQALPLTYNTDFNMQTDESFSRIFFHGIAAPLMAKSEEVTDSETRDKYGPFVVDMSFMEDLPLRDEKVFKCYGARVHFDNNQMVSAIFDCHLKKLVLPGDSQWEEAKFQAKAAAFLLVTVREHLSQTHLIVSNDASRENVKCLHPEHPIRRLLSIFCFNAVVVNTNAFLILTPDKCVIHRATALSYEGMRKVFDNSYVTSQAYEPFSKRKIPNPAVEKLAKEGKIPYISEGNEFYEIVHHFVEQWLTASGEEASDEYARAFYDATAKASKGQLYELPVEFNRENLVDLISMVIFTVTAYHELVGHVPDYTDSPLKASVRVTQENPCQTDMQSFFLGAFIAAATSPPAPQLLAEFPNYIGAGGAPQWEREVWTNFIAKMAYQTKKVQEDQWKKRDFEFKYFDPSKFECSVSV